MARTIPVNLKYENSVTLERDTLVPKTKAELVEESDMKQFVSSRQKEVWNGKQDALGFTPVNTSGDTMTGPLILSPDTITAKRQAATKKYVDDSVGAMVAAITEDLTSIVEGMDLNADITAVTNEAITSLWNTAVWPEDAQTVES